MSRYWPRSYVTLALAVVHVNGTRLVSSQGSASLIIGFSMMLRARERHRDFKGHT